MSSNQVPSVAEALKNATDDSQATSDDNVVDNVSDHDDTKKSIESTDISYESSSNNEELENKDDNNSSQLSSPDYQAKNKDAENVADGLIEVAIGNNEEDNSAAPWVREVRKTNRRQAQEIRELRALLQQQQQDAAIQTTIADPGAKPTLKSSDFDDVKYEKALADWYDKKQAFDKEQEKQQVLAEEQQQSWEKTKQTYQNQISSLGANDFEEAQAVVESILSVAQQGFLLDGAQNKALVVYALGKNPDKARELASESNPLKFVARLAAMEHKMSIKKTTPTVSPEQRVASPGGLASSDKIIDDLREKALKTGNLTESLNYRREQIRKKKQSE